MRKKLRTQRKENQFGTADRPAWQALQPSAQEVAQHCATSCAHSQAIAAEHASNGLKKLSTC
jgi:hypothetical protein